MHKSSKPAASSSAHFLGADQETLLHLYRSLIRSKLDYGCIVYGSARGSYLRMLDPIQNHALRLCLGAYRILTRGGRVAGSAHQSLFSGARISGFGSCLGRPDVCSRFFTVGSLFGGSVNGDCTSRRLVDGLVIPCCVVGSVSDRRTASTRLSSSSSVSSNSTSARLGCCRPLLMVNHWLASGTG